MPDPYRPPKRSWPQKFCHAARGMWLGMRGQRSFVVHLSVAALVVAAGVLLRVRLVQWCILALCIAAVLTAEMFNSALESLARAVEQQPNRNIEKGLDIGSGAVLLSAIGAAVVGAVIFLCRLGEILNWWS